jgi:hypothetical protein
MSFENENNELLDALQKKESSKDAEKRRGSKDELVAKIFQCCDEGGVICEQSTTQLKRMSKKDLQKTLAGYIERAMTLQLMEKVNVKRLTNATDEQQNQLIALGTLRLMHDSLCVVLEKGIDSISPYTIEGFSDGMKKEPVSQEVNNALLAIAEEADVLQYISSPYAKLGLIWMSCAATSLKRKPTLRTKKNVSFGTVESRSINQAGKLDNTFVGGKKAGKIVCDVLPNGTLRV